MIPYVRSAWLSGLRGRSFHMVFMLGLLLVGVAYLASLFSPRQPQTVALDVGLSCLRFVLVLQALLWVQELVGREIERKSVVLSLAYPVPRSSYVFGRFFGIVLLLGVAILMLALLLWLVVLLSGGGYEPSRRVALGIPYWSTVLGLYLDVIVVLAFALCLATFSTIAFLPLVLGVIFAIAGRSLGVVMDFVLTRSADGDSALVAQFGPVLRFIHYFLPDLSRLDWRAWPLYSLAPDWAAMAYSVVMALGYVLILLSIAVITFNRREFS